MEKVPIAVSNALCKAIPDRLPDVDGKTPKMNLVNAIKAVPELRDAEASNDPALRNTIKYAKMLEGTNSWYGYSCLWLHHLPRPYQRLGPCLYG